MGVPYTCQMVLNGLFHARQIRQITSMRLLQLTVPPRRRRLSVTEAPDNVGLKWIIRFGLFISRYNQHTPSLSPSPYLFWSILCSMGVLVTQASRLLASAGDWFSSFEGSLISNNKYPPFRRRAKVRAFLRGPPMDVRQRTHECTCGPGRWTSA